MLEQLTEPLKCREITDRYPDYFTFDVEGWLANPLNYALREEENVGLAEWQGAGVYRIHFCLHSARGRAAIAVTRSFIDGLFKGRTDARIAIGMIAVVNRKARWVARQAGLLSLGEIEEDGVLCEMFYQIRSD